MTHCEIAFLCISTSRSDPFSGEKLIQEFCVKIRINNTQPAAAEGSLTWIDGSIKLVKHDTESNCSGCGVQDHTQVNKE